MKKLAMTLAMVASFVTLAGCAVAPVQVPGVVADKKFIQQHRAVLNTSTAYKGKVYPSSQIVNMPNQYILVINTARGTVESQVSEYEFRNTPVGKRLIVETTEVVWYSDVKK